MDARRSQAIVGRGNIVSKAMPPGTTAVAGPTHTALVEGNIVNQADTSDETSSEDVGSEIESTSSESSDSSAEDDEEEDDEDHEVEDDESLTNEAVASFSHLSKPQTGYGTDDIKSRLATFLPAIEKANADLTHAERIDDVREGEQYVEMNIGLGVLEEQANGHSDILREAASGDHSVDTSSEEENEDEERLTCPTAKRRKTGIEEVG